VGLEVIEFTDQVAIVTGAGRGLGRLYALELAQRGATVVVNDLGSSMHGDGADSRVADAVVNEILEAGGRAIASHDSVATVEGGARIVETAVKEFGRLDVVVSNAGIFHTTEFENLTPDDWESMVNVHLHGAFYLSQPAYRVMKSQSYGRFVFISSSAGLFGQPNSAHYAAAKAGVVGLSNVIAIEGAPHGISANCVLPFGYSRMVTETVGDRDQFQGELPFLDAIEPELVVPVVVFLASRECEVTHHYFSACAGRFSRVFVGQARGWVAARGANPSADDIAAHWAQVTAQEPYSVPDSIFDEVAETCSIVGIPL
jgi:NAD(P)-dependent dehydrogenase (short-subunit alcohol dehydrogenase family)